jgi:hypothetical protein
MRLVIAFSSSESHLLLSPFLSGLVPLYVGSVSSSFSWLTDILQLFFLLSFNYFFSILDTQPDNAILQPSIPSPPRCGVHIRHTNFQSSIQYDFSRQTGSERRYRVWAGEHLMRLAIPNSADLPNQCQGGSEIYRRRCMYLAQDR